MSTPTQLCSRCGHPDHWHRFDDAQTIETTDPAAKFRCLGYDCDAAGPPAPEGACGCGDFVARWTAYDPARDFLEGADPDRCDRRGGLLAALLTPYAGARGVGWHGDRPEDDETPCGGPVGISCSVHGYRSATQAVFHAVVQTYTGEKWGIPAGLRFVPESFSLAHAASLPAVGLAVGAISQNVARLARDGLRRPRRYADGSGRRRRNGGRHTPLG